MHANVTLFQLSSNKCDIYFENSMDILISYIT